MTNNKNLLLSYVTHLYILIGSAANRKLIEQQHDVQNSHTLRNITVLCQAIHHSPI